jgi:hypothetical protein
VRSLVSLLPVLAAVVAACATVPARHPERPVEWVLVRSPMTDNLGVPIYAWDRVRDFPTAEDCSRYRVELLENAVSAVSRAKLEDVYRLHCVPATKMTPPAP